jgi:hypothetical protein
MIYNTIFFWVCINLSLTHLWCRDRMGIKIVVIMDDDVVSENIFTVENIFPDNICCLIQRRQKQKAHYISNEKTYFEVFVKCLVSRGVLNKTTKVHYIVHSNILDAKYFSKRVKCQDRLIKIKRTKKNIRSDMITILFIEHPSANRVLIGYKVNNAGGQYSGTVLLENQGGRVVCLESTLLLKNE